MEAKRYAIVGTGVRGRCMYAQPLCTDFSATTELVALCDSNALRLDAVARQLPRKLATFTDFNEMLAKTDPDGVIVATTDSAHAEYITTTLAVEKRVICEKPVCITADQCRTILAAQDRSTATCLVTHNARYGAPENRIHELLRSGRIGQPLFMQFDETLDRCHGADYFRRWHRQMANSGGLLIHKASHHFDLLNWWAASKPAKVTAQGALRFYGAAGPFRSARCLDCPHAEQCEFYADLFHEEEYRRFYLEAESADGYHRDGCVFAPEIDIHDQMAALIEYEKGIQASYTLSAYCPYESQRVVIEGTKGRIEYFARIGTGLTSDKDQLPGIEEILTHRITLYVASEGFWDVPIAQAQGGHGGADPKLLDEFFGRDFQAEPTDHMAPLDQAVQAVLIGLAANASIATGASVDVQSLLSADSAAPPA